MAKEVVLCADGTCDLNDELVRRYSVNNIHCRIVLDDHNYTDCVDIFPQDLYQTYWERGVLPKTAAVNVAEYEEFFGRFIAQGFEVVHIGLGSGLSACFQNARIAASQMEGVYLVDSRNLSSATGLLVIEAAERIARGMPARQVAEEVEALVPNAHASFVLNTLEFMKAGGRCSALAAAGANLLSLKPCIEVNSETSSMRVGKKYRGPLDKVLLQYAGDRLEKHRGRIKNDRAFITHSGCTPEQVGEVRAFLERAGAFREIHETRASCTIASHCGPGTLGVLYMTE